MAVVQSKNLVSSPPLTTPITNGNGVLTRPWSIWFRDIYSRTSYKKSNAIDDNKIETDGEILTLNESIAVNIADIATNASAIQVNTANLLAHELLEIAHGSNGSIVGLDDLADETTQGLVKRMISLSDAVASVVSVVVADVSAAPATYTQSHSQELVDLSNANKAAINALVTDMNNAIIVLNNLILESKNTGQMT